MFIPSDVTNVFTDRIETAVRKSGNAGSGLLVLFQKQESHLPPPGRLIGAIIVSSASNDLKVLGAAVAIVQATTKSRRYHFISLGEYKFDWSAIIAEPNVRSKRVTQ